MNPYRYDIQTLERKARAVRRHIVRLNANSPAAWATPGLTFRRSNC